MDLLMRKVNGEFQWPVTDLRPDTMDSMDMGDHYIGERGCEKQEVI